MGQDRCSGPRGAVHAEREWKEGANVCGKTNDGKQGWQGCEDPRVWLTFCQECVPRLGVATPKANACGRPRVIIRPSGVGCRAIRTRCETLHIQCTHTQLGTPFPVLGQSDSVSGYKAVPSRASPAATVLRKDGNTQPGNREFPKGRHLEQQQGRNIDK